MVSNMLGIRGTPPVKELGATGTTADRCVLFLPYVVVFAVATAVLLLLIYLLQGLKPYVQQRVTSNGNNYTIGGGLFTEKKKKKKCRFPSHLLGSARRKETPCFLESIQRRSMHRAPPRFSAGIQTWVVVYPRSPCMPRSRKCEKEPSAVGEQHA